MSNALVDAGLVTLTVVETAMVGVLGYGIKHLLATVRDTGTKVTVMHAMFPGVLRRVENLESRMTASETTQAATNQSVALLLTTVAKSE